MNLMSTIQYGDLPAWITLVPAVLGSLFLVLNFRSQSRQIKDQESRYQLDKEREQANKFVFWLESNLANPKIHFENNSALPIFRVVVYCNTISGDRSKPIFGSDNKALGFKAIPHGKYDQTFIKDTFDFSKVMEAHFDDTSGKRWKRTSEGAISKSSEAPPDEIRWLDTPTG